MHKSELHCFRCRAATLTQKLALMHSHVFTCLKPDNLLGVHAAARGSTVVSVLCRQGESLSDSEARGPHPVGGEPGPTQSGASQPPI